MTGLLQIRRHAASHNSQSDKRDVHKCSATSSTFLRSEWLSQRFPAIAISATWLGLRAPTIAPVTAGLRSVQATAIDPAEARCCRPMDWRLLTRARFAERFGSLKSG